MKKSNLLKPLLFMFLLSSCGVTSSASDYSYEKTEGNGDFEEPGNLIESDLTIDGVLDEEEWENPHLEVTFGETEEVPNKVTAKLYFGTNGLNVGFYTTDVHISSSTNYTDDQFVVNSDNVEFYIDTLNDKGEIAQSDDYAFLVNPEGYTEMRTGNGWQWGPWTGVVDYGVTVYGTINDDSDTDTGWGCELFLPYQTFGFNQDSVVAIAFGCRDKDTNITLSDWTGWIPDPQIIDTYISVSKDGIVKESVKGFDVASGSWSYDETTEEYTSESTNSIAVSQDLEMTGVNGTVSVDMYIGDSLTGDNGLIFQVKPSDTGLFWEGSGVRYYFWCINVDGLGLLGRTRDGTWTTLGAISADIKYNSYNNLKVVVTDNSTMYCYINGVLILTASDALYSTVQVGMRAGASGTKYKNFTVSSDTDISEETISIDGYKVVSGSFEYVDDAQTKVAALTSSSMLVSTSGNLYNGTITTELTPNSDSDNGLVFRVTDNGLTNYWESNVSYYHFFVSEVGLAYLGLVNNGSWSELGSVSISNYNAYNTYTLKVVLNDTSIKCYIDDTLMVDVTNSVCSGTEYGLRARGVGATFTLPSATN